MSRVKIFAIYIVGDILIGAGAVWAAMSHWSARQIIYPAAILFTLNGIWLLVMTIRATPPSS